jgi:hypothetical protein
VRTAGLPETLGLCALCATTALVSPAEAFEKGKHELLAAQCDISKTLDERTVTVTHYDGSALRRGAGGRINGRYVLTAAHVVDGEGRIRVRVGDSTRRAQRVAEDKTSDLALLEVDTDDRMEPVSLVKSWPSVGTTLAFKSHESEAYKVTDVRGAHADALTYGPESVSGDSGAPVFNCRGELVSINHGSWVRDVKTESQWRTDDGGVIGCPTGSSYSFPERKCATGTLTVTRVNPYRACPPCRNGNTKNWTSTTCRAKEAISTGSMMKGATIGSWSALPPTPSPTSSAA